MFRRTDNSPRKLTLLAGTLASSIVLSGLWAQSPVPVTKVSPAGSRYQPDRFPRRAAAYYAMVWGVGSLSVKLAESGEVIRFTWQVVDPEKAKVLSDKSVAPSLIAPERGVKLIVPTFEKVGQLRQSAPPEAGRSYWMAFSNAGRKVKRGDRVDVAIGTFHAQNLTVE